MNFSKTVCTLLLLLGVNATSTWAQKSDSTYQKQADFTLFKGHKPYRTWSVGGNLGGMAPVAFTRGNTDFSNWDVNLGYDVFVRKQVAHSFGLELNLGGGKVSGTNANQPNGVANGVGATLATTGTFDLIDTANVQTIGTRILVKNEANAVYNGVYTWANATNIVRSLDTDEYGPNSAEEISINDY